MYDDPPGHPGYKLIRQDLIIYYVEWAPLQQLANGTLPGGRRQASGVCVGVCVCGGGCVRACVFACVCVCVCVVGCRGVWVRYFECVWVGVW